MLGEIYIVINVEDLELKMVNLNNVQLAKVRVSYYKWYNLE
jgi:hypothetical protein